MGQRKHNSAEARKEAKKTVYMAKLMNNPTSPRKTRLVADMIRGLDVDKALAVLPERIRPQNAQAPPVGNSQLAEQERRPTHRRQQAVRKNHHG